MTVKGTMQMQKMLTRRIKKTSCNVLFVDKTTGETFVERVELQTFIPSDDKIIRYINSTLVDKNLLAVSADNVEVTEQVYALDEETFMKYATPIVGNGRYIKKNDWLNARKEANANV